MKLREIDHRLDSSLDTQELAGRFKNAAEELWSQGGRRVIATVLRGAKLKFFTPTPNDSPFAAFEDAPAFAVGVTMAKGGVVGGADPITLHMYVLDRGDSREVLLLARYTLSGKAGAQRFIEHFAAALSE